MRGKKLLAVALVVSLSSVQIGCQTAGQGAGVGALVGAAAGAGLGAIIGNQTGDAGEGALIGGLAGAAIGGMIGYQIGKMNQEQRRSLDELEQEIAQSNNARERESLSQPNIEISNLSASPDPIRQGESVTVRGSVRSYGQGISNPEGTMRLKGVEGQNLKNDSLPVKINDLGEVAFDTKIEVPQSAMPGEYTVTVTLESNGAKATETTSFMVRPATAAVPAVPTALLAAAEPAAYSAPGYAHMLAERQ